MGHAECMYQMHHAEFFHLPGTSQTGMNHITMQWLVQSMGNLWLNGCLLKLNAVVDAYMLMEIYHYYHM